MITKERKEEIIAEIAYSVNRCIDKQSTLSVCLEDLLSKDEQDWFQENCFCSYIIECGDIK